MVLIIITFIFGYLFFFFYRVGEPAVARALGAVKPVPRVLEARLVIVRLRKIKKGRIRKRSKKVGCVSDRI